MPRLDECVNQDDPSLLGCVPLTVWEDRNWFSWTVAGSWCHYCAHVWRSGMLQGWLLEVFLFIFSSSTAFYHPLIIGWLSLHVWRQAKKAFFSEEKWILWAILSAGINFACSVEVTRDIPATLQRKQPCVLCDFLFWKHLYRLTNVFHILGPERRTSQHLTIFQLSKCSNLMMPVNQSANLLGKSLQMRK